MSFAWNRRIFYLFGNLQKNMEIRKIFGGFGKRVNCSKLLSLVFARDISDGSASRGSLMSGLSPWKLAWRKHSNDGRTKPTFLYACNCFVLCFQGDTGGGSSTEGETNTEEKRNLPLLPSPLPSSRSCQPVLAVTEERCASACASVADIARESQPRLTGSNYRVSFRKPSVIIENLRKLRKGLHI